MEYNEAVRIYWAYVEGLNDGASHDQPNHVMSELINGVWYLRNGNRLLARVGTKKRQVF